MPRRRGSSWGGDTGPVGYNPYRKFKATPLDYVLVAVGIALAVALVIWALAG